MACTRTLLLVSVLVALGGCGGKAVIDGPDGFGGGGGTTTTTTAVTCDGLFQVYDAALADAVSCNPFVNMMQCDGTASVHDPCGCPVLANETNPTAVQAAVAAYDAWVAASCGPYLCGAPCQTLSPGFCSGTGPSDGVCVSAVF